MEHEMSTALARATIREMIRLIQGLPDVLTPVKPEAATAHCVPCHHVMVNKATQTEKLVLGSTRCKMDDSKYHESVHFHGTYSLLSLTLLDIVLLCLDTWLLTWMSHCPPPWSKHPEYLGCHGACDRNGCTLRIFTRSR